MDAIASAVCAVSLLHCIEKYQQIQLFYTTLHHYVRDEGSIPFTRSNKHGHFVISLTFSDGLVPNGGIDVTHKTPKESFHSEAGKTTSGVCESGFDHCDDTVQPSTSRRRMVQFLDCRLFASWQALQGSQENISKCQSLG
jgi:hypothetical protein